MLKFLETLRRWYQMRRYSKVKKQVRENLLFFGCDTSHLSDEELEQGTLNLGELINSRAVTVDEAVVALQEFATLSKKR
jgi:hypothetical protein